MAREVEHYRARIAAERASQDAGTDQDADAIRLGAPDIVPVMGNGAVSSAGPGSVASPGPGPG
jgi:hypothetical protein